MTKGFFSAIIPLAVNIGASPSGKASDSDSDISGVRIPVPQPNAKGRNSVLFCVWLGHSCFAPRYASAKREAGWGSHLSRKPSGSWLTSGSAKNSRRRRVPLCKTKDTFWCPFSVWLGHSCFAPRYASAKREAGWGSHSPLGDRQARLSGAERANHGAKRSYPSAYL